MSQYSLRSKRVAGSDNCQKNDVILCAVLGSNLFQWIVFWRQSHNMREILLRLRSKVRVIFGRLYCSKRAVSERPLCTA